MPKYFKFSDVISHCDLALSAVNSAEEEFVNRAALEISLKTGQAIVDCTESVRQSIKEIGSDFSDLRLHVKGFKNSLKVKSGNAHLNESQVSVYKGIMEVASCEQSTTQ